jgi:competence protein ComEC
MSSGLLTPSNHGLCGYALVFAFKTLGIFSGLDQCRPLGVPYSDCNTLGLLMDFSISTPLLEDVSGEKWRKMAQLILFLTSFSLAFQGGLQIAPPPLTSEHEIVFWNVGQGSWATLIERDRCFHFDMGGEYYSRTSLWKSCAGKSNLVYFSHWDWDHIGLATRFHRQIGNLCIAAFPEGQAAARKEKFLKTIPTCLKKSFSEIHELHFRHPKTRDSNSASRIFEVMATIVFPGDSPVAMEKLWIYKILKPKRIQVLDLGHHGSRTSTSEMLLDHLVNLKIAVSSARRQRYGHPHKEVQERLKRRGMSLIKTEDWGNIHWTQ